MTAESRVDAPPARGDTTPMRLPHPVVLAAVLLCVTTGLADSPDKPDAKSADAKPVPLFPEKGVTNPKGWVVRAWDDVSQPAEPEAAWKVDDEGVLHGSEPRGTWLVSGAEYGDFVLEYEFKLGEQGNSGCALRSPMKGDPAFDGLELQMVDERYNDGRDGPDKLTASFYKAIAPTKQVYKPTEWNHYVITCKGPRVTVVLNGETVQDVNLDEQTKAVERHDGSPAPSLKDRPRRGHIGFQELSRGGGHVMIRNARITVLDEQAKAGKASTRQ